MTAETVAGKLFNVHSLVTGNEQLPTVTTVLAGYQCKLMTEADV